MKLLKKAIWFDMDGTIANLYAVNRWLPKLLASDPTPYAEAAPLLNMQALARVLNGLRRKGYKIGVVSWLCRGGSAEYGEAVAAAKKEWLKKHLASVDFDYIDIIEWGDPKENGRDGILFDDEKANRDNWGGVAYDVDNIIEVLKRL